MDMKGIERGCGVREPGGVYVESAACDKTLERLGLIRCSPVEAFLFDPPLPVGAVELPARGVALIERQDGSGVFDVWDRVGAEGYPNVADMVEEIKRFGLSRRIPQGVDFSKLTPDSLVFLAHPRAILANVGELYELLAIEAEESPDRHLFFRCPCGKAGHTLDELITDDVTCAGIWWQTLYKGEASYDPAQHLRHVVRESGSTRYSGAALPHEFKPQWAEGIFARFPIGRLVVIDDPDSGRHEAALERAEKSSLPVDVEQY
jgi:hypothetical protein